MAMQEGKIVQSIADAAAKKGAQDVIADMTSQDSSRLIA